MRTHSSTNPMPARAVAPGRLAPRERGSAFVIALLIVTVLASLVIVFAHEMRTEAMGATHQAATAEARQAARGVIEAVRGDLAQDLALGEAPRLSEVPAAGGRVGGCVYWIIGPDVQDDAAHAYGIVGEASKMNLNSATPDMLIELPGMTEDLAAAIVDWRDGDTETTPGGAESDYYLTRPTPYNAQDGPFETLGELAYVRGYDETIFYGEDANRSGRLDPTEDDGAFAGVADNGDGTLDRGLYGLTTVYSVEPQLSIDGEERIDIQERSQELGQLLAAVMDEERFGEVAPQIDGRRPFASVLDFHIRNELTVEEFEQIHDKLKIGGQDQRVGVVDVYTASAQVLNALPGMEPGDGEAIVAGRPVLAADEQPGNLAWIVPILDDDKAAAVGNRLTHRSVQFTVDVVAVTEDGRGFCRLRAVLDTTPTMEDAGTLPTIVYIQDLTALGWPMDQAILDELRSGVPTEEVALQYGAE